METILKRKKLLSILLSAVLVFSVFGTCLMPKKAYAANLQINNAADQGTYDLYKFFELLEGDYVFNYNDGAPFKASMDAFIADNPGDVMFELSDVDPVAYPAYAGYKYVRPTDLFTEQKAKELGLKLQANYATWSAATTPFKTATANTDTVSFTNIPEGYYLVHSSKGATLMLVTVKGDSTSTTVIEEKNTGTSFGNLEFSIEEDAVGYSETANIVTKFTFTQEYDGTVEKLKITNDYNTKLYNCTIDEDNFPALYSAEGILVGTLYDLGVDYTLTYTDTTKIGYALTINGFAEEPTEGQISKFEQNQYIQVSSTAICNYNLGIYSSTRSQTGDAYLHKCLANAYDLNQSETVALSTESDVFKVLGMSLTKIDGAKNVLNGAKFKVFRSEGDATAGINPIYFTTSEGGYSVAASVTTNIIEIPVGTTMLNGLGDGTYYFKETVAPSGFNMLTAPVTFQISDGDSDYASFTDTESAWRKYVSGGLAVENAGGIIIPGTGGIGIIIFSIIGAGIIIGAIAYRMTKKRRSGSHVSDLID